jgi:hypothetical protein
MIRYIFKGTNIKIYTEQNFTQEEKHRLIYEYHDALLGGHSGVFRIIEWLKLNYNWKHLKTDVKSYIKNCEIYQKTKQPMIITTTVTKPFGRICMDIVGLLSLTNMGNIYIPTIQGELTRYALAIALATTDAQTIAQAFVECFVCIYGIPISILTDCGTNFLSDLFKNVCKLLDIEKSKITP